MPVFDAADGTSLGYQLIGVGTPLICLAGGPQDPAYLGNLGGAAADRQLALLHYRGTGLSAPPADSTSYRCDRLVDDVDALRGHLGLDRIDLLAHCAGANVALQYAARYPERVSRLLLITPSTRAVGLVASSDLRRAIVEKRVGEPWFGPVAAAFEAIQDGRAGEADWDTITPLSYGRWDAAARAHHALADAAPNAEAVAMFGADGVFDPPATRLALAELPAPVLLLAGEVDVAAPPGIITELAGMFADGTLLIQPGGGHFPWLDDPGYFSAAVDGFLSGR